MALKMQREYGDDLQVVFVESQGADDARVEEFALQRGWLGTSAVWTTERPVSTGARGLPNCVILDAEGRIAMMGSPFGLHAAIEELVQTARRTRNSAPDDLPRELKPIWKSLQKGHFADVVEDVARLSQREDDPDVVARAEDLAATARSRAAARLARIERMVAAGSFAHAEDLAEDLLESVDGLAEVDGVRALLERLGGDELEAERAAEDSLARVEHVLWDQGVDAKLARVFARIAEKHAGTIAAGRAARLAQICGDS